MLLANGSNSIPWWLEIDFNFGDVCRRLVSARPVRIGKREGMANIRGYHHIGSESIPFIIMCLYLPISHSSLPPNLPVSPPTYLPAAWHGIWHVEWLEFIIRLSFHLHQGNYIYSNMFSVALMIYSYSITIPLLKWSLAGVLWYFRQSAGSHGHGTRKMEWFIANGIARIFKCDWSFHWYHVLVLCCCI